MPRKSAAKPAAATAAASPYAAGPMDITPVAPLLEQPEAFVEPSQDRAKQLVAVAKSLYDFGTSTFVACTLNQL